MLDDIQKDPHTMRKEALDATRARVLARAKVGENERRELRELKAVIQKKRLERKAQVAENGGRASQKVSESR
jgi:hypothetical protein